MTAKYKDTDRCTDIILDFIAGGPAGDTMGNPTGETDGNYNAYFGVVHSALDFGRFTLREIYNFQANMLLRDPRSTAIGRYQFLRRTLQALQTKLMLPDGTIFTPDLQDELAVQLLIGRAYPSWWRGEVDDTTFAHGLSMEWASLPDPFYGGRSHFDGTSINHAATTLQHVYDMLAKARAAQPS